MLGCGCGDGGDPDGAASTTTASTDSPTTTTTTAEAPTDPIAIVTRMLDASLAGQPTTWRSFYSDDATTAFKDDDTRPLFGEAEWVDVDFDGDGVRSSADWIQFSMAMNPATRATGSWSCTPVPDDEVDCTGAGMDAFAELAGAGEWTA
jgi:hypothetical protein